MKDSWSDDLALTIVRDHARQPGPMLLTLLALQERFGYVEPSSLTMIAKELNVSRAEIYGVLTYYSDFHTSPVADNSIHVCTAEACQSLGSRQLVQDLAAKGYAIGARSADGKTDVKNVYCLGNCALGPAAMINGNLRGRVSAESIVREVVTQ